MNLSWDITMETSKRSKVSDGFLNFMSRQPTNRAVLKFLPRNLQCNHCYLRVYNAMINVPRENTAGNCFFHGVRNQDY